ncbi:MAG: hypothetical protein GX825_09335 [Syntrophomonadaceae bacterium]|nr:hypothetical protein [Syntrophomonadaceae bacterium]
MSIFLITIGFLFLAIYEAPPLIQAEEWPLLITAGSIWLFGFAISILLALHISVPSPTLGIAFISNLVLELLRFIF